jgi:hypothetical protein
VKQQGILWTQSYSANHLLFASSSVAFSGTPPDISIKPVLYIPTTIYHKTIKIKKTVDILI